jgi:hypothetical protein
MDLFHIIDIFALFSVPYPDRPDRPTDHDAPGGSGNSDGGGCLIV